MDGLDLIQRCFTPTNPLLTHTHTDGGRMSKEFAHFKFACKRKIIEWDIWELKKKGMLVCMDEEKMC